MNTATHIFNVLAASFFMTPCYLSVKPQLDAMPIKEVKQPTMPIDELTYGAEELKATMLHQFTFTYRNELDILKKVRRIREGSGHVDMIQDLLEQSLLGDKYPAPLAAINYDVAQNVKAKELSQEMAVLLANNNGSKDDGSKAKLLRDKAYTMLYNHMSTVREFGRFVFWKDETRLQK